MENNKNVIFFGENEKVGDWIVVNSEMTKVLASASTPEEAMRKAGIDPHGQRSADSRPIVMQVPDPSLTCLY